LELIEENELTSAIANSVPLGICVLDPQLRFRWANPAVVSFLEGPLAGRDIVGVFLADLLPEMADGPALDRLSAVAMTGQAESWENLKLTGIAPGTSWWRGYGLPLFGDRSEPPYDVLLVMADETQRRLEDRAAEWRGRRDELLSQTATRLLESRDPQRLVDDLCKQVMRFLDCQVFFNYLADDESGRLRLNAYAGVAARDADRIVWLDRGVAVCGCVADDGERIIVEDIQNREDPRTVLVKGYGVQAYCCHPLIVQGRTIGTLSFGARSRLRFAPEEVDVMRSVANLVAMAMNRIAMEKQLQESEERYRALFEQHERLYREQLNIAETLQSAFIHLPAEVGPVRVSHLYRSATEYARVGGDFYDAFPAKDGRIVVLIGDVSGQGVEAARLANLTKDVIRAFTEVTRRPNEILVRTNRLLLEESFGGFVTVFLGIFDLERGLLRYASAGHPDALLRRPSGEILLLRGHSAPLGVHPEAGWLARQVDIGSGDMLFLYTDGVTEARRDKQMFGEERLRNLVRRRNIATRRLPQIVLDQVLEFCGQSLRDDLAIMAVSLTAYRPSRPERRPPVFAQESLMTEPSTV
jgi:serine phosphatase RsbU (regulator of sigma subunit)